MTFSRFVIRNSFRNKRRTALTVLSVGFSLFLLIVLRTLLTTLLNPPVTEASALRLAVRNRTSLAQQLPISYMPRIERIPGVNLVMPLQWFGGVYIEPKNFFANFATDPSKLWEMFPEYRVSEETKQKFLAQRTAAVVGVDLMERYAWKVGDKVTLLGTIFPVDLEFDIVGTFESDVQGSTFYFRTDYFWESVNASTIGTFWVQAGNASLMSGIAEAIDSEFKNSTAETKTESEKAFMLGFVSMLGNVQVLMGSVAIVVIFTMLLVSASTMAMTIRERLREVGILKSMGYPRRVVLMLILGEAVFITFLGGFIGCAAAFSLGFVDIYTATQGFIDKFLPSPWTYLTAIAAGVIIGLVSGFIPAFQASNMTITQALRRLD